MTAGSNAGALSPLRVEINLGRFKKAIRKWKLGRRSPSDVFLSYYLKNKWGSGESRSGKGSNMGATQEVRAFLPPLVADLGVKTFLDLPCGDYHWMQHVDLGVSHYTGGDIVPDMIAANTAEYARDGVRFEVIDLIQGSIPRHDLILVRDCLVHLSEPHVKEAVANIKASGSTWLLTTTFPNLGTNEEIVTGEWRRIDLQKPPFGFPAPDRMIAEGMEHEKGQCPDKMLGLWQIKNLPDWGG